MDHGCALCSVLLCFVLFVQHLLQLQLYNTYRVQRHLLFVWIFIAIKNYNIILFTCSLFFHHHHRFLLYFNGFNFFFVLDFHRSRVSFYEYDVLLSYCFVRVFFRWLCRMDSPDFAVSGVIIR